MNQTGLFIGLITGCIGMGYFIYGKKQGKLIPLLAGIGLFIIPYIFENVLLISFFCLCLCVLPFIIRSD